MVALDFNNNHNTNLGHINNILPDHLRRLLLNDRGSYTTSNDELHSVRADSTSRLLRPINVGQTCFPLTSNIRCLWSSFICIQYKPPWHGQRSYVICGCEILTSLDITYIIPRTSLPWWVDISPCLNGELSPCSYLLTKQYDDLKNHW